jgi:U3 small nucleolar RNA-associated protein 4
LEVWKLATANEDIEATGDQESDGENEVLKELKAKNENKFKITSFPEKFLELRSQKDEMILSASISNNGKWIAYTTINSIRFFYFDTENSKPNLMRIKNTPEEFQPCTLLTFSNDKLFTVNFDKLIIFDISSSSIEHRQTIELENFHRDLVHKIEVSKCGKFLIVASLCGGISIWCFKKGKFVHERNLPKHKSPVTSMRIHKSNPKLFVAFSDNKICEYDLEEFLISESITSGDDPTKNAISHICLDPNNSSAIIFNQNNSINVARKNEEEEIVKRVSKKKKSEVKNESRTVNVVKKFDNVS